MEGVVFLLKKFSIPPLPSLVRGTLRSRNTSYLHAHMDPHHMKSSYVLMKCLFQMPSPVCD